MVRRRYGAARRARQVLTRIKGGQENRLTHRQRAMIAACERRAYHNAAFPGALAGIQNRPNNAQNYQRYRGC